MSMCVYDEVDTQKTIEGSTAAYLAQLTAVLIIHWIGEDYYTVFRKRNIHSRFFLYLRGKCPHFHKIFRKCLEGNKHFTCN